LEEVIAAAYKEARYSVILTPRSEDKGRDVIATSQNGLVSARLFDQVKAYGPGHVVTLDDVHSMLGVLSAEKNVSKGIITTTSDFAPGVHTDERIKQFMPHRLELRPKERLLEWLTKAGGKDAGG
jgi:restriction system protein